MISSFYDFIIYGFLAADGLLIAAVFLRIKKGRAIKKNAGQPAPLIFCIMLVLAWLVVFYGSFIEPRFITVKKQAIQLGGANSDKEALTTETLRAILVSDLHLGPYKKEKFVEKLVAKIHQLEPDIVFMAGDFVFDHRDEAELLAPLKNLKAPLGVFAVLGNHDYGRTRSLFTQEGGNRAEKIKQMLEDLGIKVLVNAGTKLTKGEKQIWLLGTDEIWTGEADIDTAVKSLGATKMPHPNILLVHNPDYVFDAEKYGVDLMLSGHTHAGQIRLPIIGPLVPMLEKLGKNQDQGIFKFNDTQLFITKGVGEWGPRARLLAPPEIVLLEINL